MIYKGGSGSMMSCLIGLAVSVWTITTTVSSLRLSLRFAHQDEAFFFQLLNFLLSEKSDVNGWGAWAIGAFFDLFFRFVLSLVFFFNWLGFGLIASFVFLILLLLSTVLALFVTILEVFFLLRAYFAIFFQIWLRSGLCFFFFQVIRGKLLIEHVFLVALHVICSFWG